LKSRKASLIHLTFRRFPRTVMLSLPHRLRLKKSKDGIGVAANCEVSKLELMKG